MRTTKKLLSLLVVVVCTFNTGEQLHAQWSRTAIAGTNAVVCLTASGDGTKLFAGMNGAGVFYSSATGTTWTSANTALDGSSVRAMAVSGAHLFTGTDKGVFQTVSATVGDPLWKGWSRKNFGLLDSNITSLAVSTDGAYLFAGTGSGVYRSSDFGTRWNISNAVLATTYVNALAVSGASLFAATLSGIFRSSDNGTTWTPANTGLTNTNVFTIGVSTSGILVGTDDGIFMSTNNGASWEAKNAGLTHTDVNCIFVDGTKLFVGTFSGGVFFSSDKGTTWKAINTGLTTAVVNALIVYGSNLFAGGSGIWKRPAIEVVTNNDQPSAGLPTHFSLQQNYPNPFNPSTTIAFTIPTQSMVVLKVYDAYGKEVATIQNGDLAAGEYSRQWNAAGFTSGMYFYRLHAGSYVETKRLILLK